jgi:hypothetical protein
MEGFFIALVVDRQKESSEAEMTLPLLSSYTQSLYQNTVFFFRRPLADDTGHATGDSR